jgi:hypothetical protein
MIAFLGFESDMPGSEMLTLVMLKNYARLSENSAEAAPKSSNRQIA